MPGQIVIACVAELTLYGFWAGEGVIPELLCLLEKHRVTKLTAYLSVPNVVLVALIATAWLDGGVATCCFPKSRNSEQGWRAGPKRRAIPVASRCQGLAAA